MHSITLYFVAFMKNGAVNHFASGPHVFLEDAVDDRDSRAIEGADYKVVSVSIPVAQFDVMD